MMSFLNLVYTELRKKLKIDSAYWLNLLADQILFILGFLMVTGILEISTEGQYTEEAILASMIGWLTWRVAGGCMAEVPDSVAQDARVGTLEQVWLSGNHPANLLFARCVALVVYYTCRIAIMALIIMPVLGLTASPGIIAFVLAFLVYLLTLAGILGLAFVIAGLHLVYKNVNMITYALATVLLFLTGAIVSFDGIPILYTLSRILPLSIGIDLLREIIVAQNSFGDIVMSSSFGLLWLNTAVYLFIGLIVLNWSHQKVLSSGSLAHY